ncbi:glycosyl hydrolase 53 family protein [Deinococcus sp. PEB2-63]
MTRARASLLAPSLVALLSLTLSACQSAPPAATLRAQATLPSEWIRGIDLSEARAAESRGVQFRDRGGTVKPAAQIARDHAFNWVRIRLMVDPNGQYGLYQDLPYVKDAVKDAKTRGLKVLLDLHYSHWWADPGNQWTPSRWAGQDVNTLANSVYAYTKDVITQLRAQGTAPDMVQIGNEINGGMLWEAGRIANMANFVKLTNAGATAVRDASGGTSSMPGILVHIAKDGNAAETVAWYRAFIAAGGWVDAIGLSYYPMWHGSLSDLGGTLAALRSAFPWAKLYLAETAYYWAPNQKGYTGLPYPQTPAGQTQYLKALTPVVKNNGGNGIFYWGAYWSQSSRWLTAPGWGDDDASRRSLFDDSATATPAIDGLN